MRTMLALNYCEDEVGDDCGSLATCLQSAASVRQCIQPIGFLNPYEESVSSS